MEEKKSVPGEEEKIEEEKLEDIAGGRRPEDDKRLILSNGKNIPIPPSA